MADTPALTLLALMRSVLCCADAADSVIEEAVAEAEIYEVEFVLPAQGLPALEDAGGAGGEGEGEGGESGDGGDGDDLGGGKGGQGEEESAGGPASMLTSPGKGGPVQPTQQQRIKVSRPQGPGAAAGVAGAGVTSPRAAAAGAGTGATPVKQEPGAAGGGPEAMDVDGTPVAAVIKKEEPKQEPGVGEQQLVKDEGGAGAEGDDGQPQIKLVTTLEECDDYDPDREVERERAQERAATQYAASVASIMAAAAAAGEDPPALPPPPKVGPDLRGGVHQARLLMPAGMIARLFKLLWPWLMTCCACWQHTLTHNHTPPLNSNYDTTCRCTLRSGAPHLSA